MKSITNATLIAGMIVILAGRSLYADDPQKLDAAKADAKKTDVAKADSTKADAGKADAAKASSAKPDAAKADSAKKNHHKVPASLGLFVTTAHPALASNLPDILSPEQGLLVEGVLENSPAAKAGIKQHDLLTSYDDQKLFSAEQLTKLIHSDHPGRVVSLGYLREGKLEKVDVTLSASDPAHQRSWVESPETIRSWHRHLRDLMRPLHPRRAANSEWENFDSLTVKKLAEGKLRAEVQYLDKAGKMQKHVFEGTREEIRTSIEAEKDLKPHERVHLLRSLNLASDPEQLLVDPDWLSDKLDDAF
jgi:hypothetical protein